MIVALKSVRTSYVEKKLIVPNCVLVASCLTITIIPALHKRRYSGIPIFTVAETSVGLNFNYLSSCAPLPMNMS